MANAGRKMVSGINTRVTIKSVKLDPNSKAYKKVIADSKGQFLTKWYVQIYIRIPPK